MTVLERVRERLSDPERWTQGVSARDKNGCETGSTNTNACSWCLLGAVIAETEFKEGFSEATHSLRGVLPKSADGLLSNYNDERTHKTILRLIDRAIEAEK